VLPNFLRPLTVSHGATGFLQSLDFQMMVAVCCAFGGGFILAGISASIGAAKRRPVYRITPEAGRRFFESLEDERDVPPSHGVSRSGAAAAEAPAPAGSGRSTSGSGGVAASPTVDTGDRDRDVRDRDVRDRDARDGDVT